jgi:hypothetical protein
MALIALGLAAAVLLVIVAALTPDELLPFPVVAVVVSLLRLLPYAMLGSQFAAMYLTRVRPQK